MMMKSDECDKGIKNQKLHKFNDLKSYWISSNEKKNKIV